MSGDDKAIDLWMEDVINYITGDGFEIEKDADGEYYVLHPERYGETKIWITSLDCGLVLKVYTDPRIFENLEYINIFNRNLHIVKIIAEDEMESVAFCAYIPYLTIIGGWLREMIDNYMDEIRLVHDKLS